MPQDLNTMADTILDLRKALEVIERRAAEAPVFQRGAALADIKATAAIALRSRRT